MANQNSSERTVWVYHPRQELGAAIAESLDGFGPRYQPINQDGLRDTDNKPACIIVFEEREKELADILTNLLKNWLGDGHQKLPRIVLLTFADRLHLKAVFTRGMAFPCFSECLKLGVLKHFNLPANWGLIHDAVNAEASLIQPEVAGELKASLNAGGRTFIAPNLGALRLLNRLISNTSEVNEKRKIIVEAFELMNEDGEIDTGKLRNFIEDVAIELPRKKWPTQVREKLSNRKEEKLWKLLYELLEKVDHP